MFSFRETDSQKRKGNGSSSKGRCPFRKNQGLQFVTVLFLRVLWCCVFFACGRSLASIDQQHGAVSRVTVGGFLSHPGSVVASYQSAMGPGPKVKFSLLVSAELKKAVNCEPSWPWKEQKSGVMCVLDVLWHDHHVVTRDQQLNLCRSSHGWTFRGRLRGLTVRHHLPCELWRVQA